MKAKKYNESLGVLQDSLKRRVAPYYSAIENLPTLASEDQEAEAESIVNGLRFTINQVFDETAFPAWYANEEI